MGSRNFVLKALFSVTGIVILLLPADLRAAIKILPVLDGGSGATDFEITTSNIADATVNNGEVWSYEFGGNIPGGSGGRLDPFMRFESNLEAHYWVTPDQAQPWTDYSAVEQDYSAIHWVEEISPGDSFYSRLVFAQEQVGWRSAWRLPNDLFFTGSKMYRRRN